MDSVHYEVAVLTQYSRAALPTPPPTPIGLYTDTWLPPQAEGHEANQNGGLDPTSTHFFPDNDYSTCNQMQDEISHISFAPNLTHERGGFALSFVNEEDTFAQSFINDNGVFTPNYFEKSDVAPSFTDHKSAFPVSFISNKDTFTSNFFDDDDVFAQSFLQRDEANHCPVPISQNVQTKESSQLSGFYPAQNFDIDIASSASDIYSTSGSYSTSDSAGMSSDCPSWRGKAMELLLKQAAIENGRCSKGLDVDLSSGVHEMESSSESENVFEANLQRVALEIVGLGSNTMQDEEDAVPNYDHVHSFKTDETSGTYQQNFPAIQDEISSGSYHSAKSGMSSASSLEDREVQKSLVLDRSESKSNVSGPGERSSVNSEDNFADAEISETYSDIVKGIKSKRSKKFKATLETIHSPLCAVPISKDVDMLEDGKLLTPSFNATLSNMNTRLEPVQTLKEKLIMLQKDDMLASNSNESVSFSSTSEPGEPKSFRSSSNDSGAETADTVEGSTLNPNCQPFVPRALRVPDDSGLPNSTNNVTRFSSLVDSIGVAFTPNKIEQAVETIFEHVSPLRVDSDSSVVHLHNLRVPFENFPSPYLCPVNHRGDFVPVQSLMLDDLPIEFRTEFCLETIVLISQRVVQLEVLKPQILSTNTKSGICDGTPNFLDVQNECLGDITEHIATGFVQFVDKNSLEIRTHSNVLKTPEDVENTKITFSLSFPQHGRPPLVISCKAQINGFKLNKYSQSVTFSLKTPTELTPHLHWFQDFPVLSPSSFFEDSAYSTESNSDIVPSPIQKSPESAKLEQYKDPLLSFGASESIWAAGESEQLFQGDRMYRDKSPELDMPLWASEDLSDDAEFDFPYDVLPPLPEDKFGFLGIDDESVYRAFVSGSDEKASRRQKQFSKQRDPSISSRKTSIVESLVFEDPDDQEQTPLVEIVERRLERSNPEDPYQEKEPFGQAGLYNLFSSFAGDQFMDASPLLSQDGGSDPDNLQSRQEYEGLVYDQNRNPAEYKRRVANIIPGQDPASLIKATRKTQSGSRLASFSSAIPGTREEDSVFDSIAPSDEALKASMDALNSVFSTSVKRTTLKDLSHSYDCDLLDLDGNLNRQCDQVDFEKLVDDILDEEESSSRRASRPPGNKGKYCLIISHPHGGPKSVSVGQFSRHNHVGGDLYDTPTCMGSCGAPIIALGSASGEAYVTQMVHAGTSVIRGLPLGVGMAGYIGDTNLAQSRVVTGPAR